MKQENQPIRLHLLAQQVCHTVFHLPKEVVQPLNTVAGFSKETVLCGTDITAAIGKTLEAKPGFTDYVWNNGTTGSTLYVISSGKYWVTYKAPCNTRIDTFLVSWKQVESVLPEDTIICNQRLPFKLKAGQADSYLWFDNSNHQSIEINTEGLYWLTYQKEQCLITDSINITMKDCPCSVNVPNAFSPNGDGLNDYFKPVIGLGCVPFGYTLKIFNRFGQIVYSSFNEFDKGWDGKYNDANADGGSYYYYLTFKSKYYDGAYSKKGDFVLIR